MRDARLTKRGHFMLALIFFLCGLNAAPAVSAQTTAPPPTSAPAVTPLTGKIAHVTILGNKNIPTDAIRAALTQKVGDPYRPEAAEKDRTAVQDMGVFTGKVSLSAALDPASGVDLTYTVAEYPVIKSIQFTANTPTKEPTVPAATLLAQMKTRTGQVLNTKVLGSDMVALFNHETGYVSKQGYLFDVSAAITFNPSTDTLTIPLVEKHIQSIQITGNTNVKTADILAQMHTKSGDLYNANAIGKDLGAIYEMGGFKEIRGGVWTEVAPGQITVTIPVVEREAATLDKLDEKQGKAVPFLYDPITNPFPVIQVSINGQTPLSFIVDTGTTAALSLDPWAAAQLGLKKQDLTEKGNGYRYATAPIQSAVLQGTDRANDVPFHIEQAQVLDLGFLIEAVQGRHVAGLIGLGMLNPVTTRFDFAAKTLTVFDYPHPPLRLPGATVRPLRRTSDGLFTVHVTLTPDAAADLILDTGSTSTGVPLATIGALHPTATSYRRAVEHIDGLYLCPDLRLPGLNLGPLRVPDVVVSAVPLARTSLGMDLLAGYRLTLDGPNAQLALEPSAAGRRFVQGWSGLDLKQTGAIWSVREIEAGSPARQAGVQVGDEIVTISGRGVSGLSPLQLGMLVTAPPGVPLPVSLRRGKDKTTRDKTLEVSWVPLDEFSAPRHALDGLTLKKANGGPWVIVNVLTGCPGDQAGLQAGDEIIRMDGALVADIPLDQLLKLMGQLPESITLSVMRAGRAEPLSVKLSAPVP